jgi:hypothetical protein
MRRMPPRVDAPPCDPATLNEVCAGSCGRRLHRHRPKRICAAGHPAHERRGLCTACAKADLFATCPHDEGEPCDCGAS